MTIKKINPIRIALVIPFHADYEDEAIRALESIRQQDLIPWHVRVVETGTQIGTEAYDQALRNLREFCPDVQTVWVSDLMNSTFKVYDTLVYKDFDVTVHMNFDAVLMPYALKRLVEPFYDPKVEVTEGKHNQFRYRNRWHLIWCLVTGRAKRDLFAFRAFTMRQLHDEAMSS